MVVEIDRKYANVVKKEESSTDSRFLPVVFNESEYSERTLGLFFWNKMTLI